MCCAVRPCSNVPAAAAFAKFAAACAQGLKALAAAASLDRLHHLDLSHNQLGPSAAEGLQQLLSSAQKLQALKLNNTAVGGTGVGGLAAGLSDSSSLQHLDLSCTQLDSEGMFFGSDVDHAVAAQGVHVTLAATICSA